jgi:adenylate cyclase
MKRLIFPILIMLLGLPMYYQATPLQILKLKTFDYLIPEKEPTGYFTILNITDKDVRAEGGYPFPRKRLAEIQTQLVDKGALGVGWVIAFADKDRFGGDSIFSSSLRYAPSVLAMFESENGEYPPTTGTVILGDNITGIPAIGVTQNIPMLRVSATQGIASAPVDADNLVRQIPLLMQTPKGWVASFGTEVLKMLAGQKTYILKGSASGIEEISVRGIPPTKLDKYGRQWIHWVDTEQTTLQEMNVEGKFVFVGVTARGVMPQIATPSGLLEPHKIQAALSESILLENTSYIPNWNLSVEWAIFLILNALIWLLLTYLGVTWGLVLTSLSLLGAMGGGYWLIQQGILIDASWSLVSGFITASTAFYIRFREQYKLRQQIKKQFEHYLDPRQVKELQKNPDLLKLGGEKRTCTFLFTDLRGFTALSESVSPEQVTYIMNKVLTAQQIAVQKHGGMVDKYIGDAMMAIFNAPLDLKNHSKVAIECALDIIENIKQVNVKLKEEGLPSIVIGMGINSGEAIIGNMGSENRFDYTAIGDAVNTAARLESATKERGVDLLIGKQTEAYCGFHLKELEPILVKGKAKPLKIFTWNIDNE